MGCKVGKVEYYTGPKQVGAPDDLEAVIVKFINGAKKKLEIAVQELENKKIAKAIINARKKKLLVKLVIEQDYLRTNKIMSDPWKKTKKLNELNREIHNAILRSDIDVKCDYNTSIFHQKFIVRDGQSVLTGSTNFTPTGTESNLNHIVIVHDADISKIYSREFREIQQGHFGKRNEGHDPIPSCSIVSNVPVKVLFAPDHNPEMEIMKQMFKATERIDFAIFTFAKTSGIDDAMIRLLQTGMTIRGAFDGQQGAQDWAAIPNLKNNGAELYKVKKGNGVGKLHHKLMLLDDQLIIAGSFNYTGPANRLNDENIIILGDLDTTKEAERKAQKKLAKYAKKEIDRIIDDHGAII